MPFFLCPSDGGTAAFGGPIGRTNYHASIGWNPNPTNQDGTTGGIFFVEFTNTQWGTRLNKPRSVRIADISDGTSNTVVWAEIKRGLFAGSVTGTQPGDLVAWDIVNAPAGNMPPTGNCNVLPSAITTGTVYRYAGLQYHRSFAFTSFYSHIKPPNSPLIDCSDLNSHTVTARSFHQGGVNVCLCDGSVRFISDSINLQLWQYLGARADGQPTPLN